MNALLRPFEQVDLMISADGQIYAHNMTPELARVLAEIDPDNEIIRQRLSAAQPNSDETKRGN